MIQKKICLLGASSVGKTSLVRQFVEGIFDDKYLTTIGVKIDKKKICLEDFDVQFMLWDIEGSDRYNKFQARYLRGAAAFIIVVDRTRQSSLTDAIEIFEQARQASDCPAIITVNKSDLPAAWSLDDPQTLAFKSLFDRIFSTSAKTGDGVEEMFIDIASYIMRENHDQII